MKPLEAYTGLTLTPQGFVQNAQTEEEKFLGKFRGLIGLGLMDPQTEASRQNAVNQFNARTERNLDSILKQEGIPKEGTLLYDRLGKVIERKAEEGKK
jgi:hypothetical protein